MSTLYKYVTNGVPVTYVDVDEQHTPEAIRTHWARTFSELGNCQAEEQKAKEGEKLKGLTQEGEEVEVDRVVTFVKKVGTKGADGDQVDETNAACQQEFDAWYESMGYHNDNLNKRTLEAFGPVINDPARKRLIDSAPMLSQLCKRLLIKASAVLEHPCEVNFTALQMAVNDGVEAVARVEGDWPEAPLTPAWQPGDKLLLDYLDTDGKLVKVGLRLAMAAPALLAELQAQRELLATLLEVAVFYSGNRQTVIDRLARLDAVIAEVSGG